MRLESIYIKQTNIKQYKKLNNAFISNNTSITIILIMRLIHKFNLIIYFDFIIYNIFLF